MSSVSGDSVPAVYYRSQAGGYDAYVDSAWISFQDDSIVVLASYETIVTPSGAPLPAHSAGSLSVAVGDYTINGDVILTYTNGADPDTATLRPDGVTIGFATHYDNGNDVSLGRWTFNVEAPALNPIPRITSISPNAVVLDSPAFPLTIDGSDFLPASSVLLGNSLISGGYVSPRQMVVTIPSWALQNPDSVAVRVVNPHTVIQHVDATGAPVTDSLPDGGLSNIAKFAVNSPVPVVTDMSPTTAPPGSPPLTLTIHGSNFNSYSVAYWNGAPLQRIAALPTSVTSLIDAARLATPGTAQVTVQTAPPNGGTSQPLTFSVSGSPVQLLSVQSLPLITDALVADPTRPLVYAAVGTAGGASANSVIAFDPATASATWSLPVAGNPTTLAISDDGQYLYVGLGSDSTIARIALGTHTIDQIIPLVRGNWPPYHAIAIAVLPQAPTSVAVINVGQAEPSDVGIVVYDNGVPRPAQTPTDYLLSSFTLVPGSPPMLYATDATTTPQFYSIAILADGPHMAAPPNTFMSGINFASSGGLLVSSGGYVGNPAADSIFGHINGFNNRYAAVVLSSDSTRAYDVQSGRIVAGDVSTFQTLGAVPVPGVQSDPISIVRWGTHGLAFQADERLWFVESDVVH